MDEKYILLLVQRLYENQSKEDAYAIPLEQGGKEFNYLKESVQEYLKTNEGKLAIKETNGEFNWADVRPFVPLHFWAEKSIFPLFPNGNGPYSMGNYAFSDFVVKKVSELDRLA